MSELSIMRDALLVTADHVKIMQQALRYVPPKLLYLIYHANRKRARKKNLSRASKVFCAACKEKYDE